MFSYLCENCEEIVKNINVASPISHLHCKTFVLPLSLSAHIKGKELKKKLGGNILSNFRIEPRTKFSPFTNTLGYLNMFVLK